MKIFARNLWNRVYTDGSATDAVRDDRGGIYIEWTDGSTESHSIPTGSHSSNYKAEAKALEAATLILLNHPNPLPNTVFLTDAISVLQALKNPQQASIHNLIALLSDLNTKTQNTVLQWVPGHCNIAGNETADSLAKKGAKMTQIADSTDLSEAKTLTKAAIRKKWMSSHPDYNKNDPYYHLQRAEQVIVFRLRNNHNRLRQHMHTKLKIGDTPLCQCGQGPENSHHVLQQCPRFQALRTQTWQNPTTLDKKLYGGVEDLRRTAQFIRSTGLTV